MGYCAKTERRDAWYCDSGVWVGVYGPHGGSGQHVPLRPSSSLWSAKHRRPDHLYQWNKSCWTSSDSLSKLHKGKPTFQIDLMNFTAVYATTTKMYGVPLVKFFVIGTLVNLVKVRSIDVFP